MAAYLARGGADFVTIQDLLKEPREEMFKGMVL